MKAILGLGGNLGNPEQNIRGALDAIDSLCKTNLLRVSNLYSTEAVEVNQPQPPYINCVAEIDTQLSPHALLGACLGIESAMGRIRTGYKTPRTVDIDLLLYEGANIESEELTLPHPRILYRAFVMIPLKDLFPNSCALGLNFGKGLNKVADQKIEFYKTWQ